MHSGAEWRRGRDGGNGRYTASHQRYILLWSPLAHVPLDDSFKPTAAGPLGHHPLSPQQRLYRPPPHPTVSARPIKRRGIVRLSVRSQLCDWGSQQIVKCPRHACQLIDQSCTRSVAILPLQVPSCELESLGWIANSSSTNLKCEPIVPPPSALSNAASNTALLFQSSTWRIEIPTRRSTSELPASCLGLAYSNRLPHSTQDMRGARSSRDDFQTFPDSSSPSIQPIPPRLIRVCR